jgi:hypothetical protein
VDPASGVDDVERKNISFPGQDSKSGRPARRCTNHALAGSEGNSASFTLRPFCNWCSVARLDSVEMVPVSCLCLEPNPDSTVILYVVC